MTRKKTAAAKPRGYTTATTDEKRRAVLRDAGLALPDLTGAQLGQLYGLEQLAKDTKLEPHTLRRVLLGEHGKEPVEALYAIAKAPGWARLPEVPTGFDVWRLLWHGAHEAFMRGDE